MSTDEVWLVHVPCDCDFDHCYARETVGVFASEQTARQEAEIQAKSYGHPYPDQFISQMRVSKKLTR